MSASMTTNESIPSRIGILREKLREKVANANDKFNQFAAKSNAYAAVDLPSLSSSASDSLRQRLKIAQVAIREADTTAPQFTGISPKIRKTTIA